MSLLVGSKYVVISQGPRSLFSRILAAAFFTAMVLCIIKMYNNYYDLGYINIMYFYGSAMFLVFGFSFSFSSNFVFDFKKHRFREEIQIGVFHFGWWEPLPTLEYVSIFRQSEQVYVLKIFISKNDAYTIGGFKSAEQALEAGTNVSKKLEIDLWDASDPHNGKWL